MLGVDAGIIFSVVGFFSYLRDKKFKIVVIYLFFLSIILEVLHFVIPERTFQFHAPPNTEVLDYTKGP